MRSFGWVAAALMLSVGAAPALSAPVKLWETTGLKTPESALPDPTGSFAYVSNVAGKSTDKDGDGFISKVSLKDGKVLELAWVKGLNAPKGLALVGDRLYVSDIDQLVEIDATNGSIVARHDAAGAKFLNDVTADAAGRVYVSDSDTSTIWRLADGKLEKWLEGESLKYPNGLLAQGDRLVIAAWGPKIEDGKWAPANLLEVSLDDKSVADMGDGTPIGNLDGIEPLDKTSYLVTDWIAGKLYRIDRSGRAEQLIQLGQGTADIGYVPGERLLLIPMMQDDKLIAYRLE